MRRAVMFVSAAAVVLLTAGLFAQSKPNFAGKWTLVPEKSDAAAAGAAAGGRAGGGGGGRRGGGGGRQAGGGVGLGQSPTITQDDATLTIERAVGQNNVKSIYKLDGSESKNSMPMGRQGGTMDSTSKASWDGTKLVITTATTMGGSATESKMTMSLDADGTLVVESSRPGAQGAAPTTVKAVYKKG